MRYSRSPKWAAMGLLAVVAGGMVRQWRRRRGTRGKVALVTGGSRGLGLLIAEELVRRGVRVVLSARDPQELERARSHLLRLGGDVTIIAADLEHASAISTVVEAARAAFGRIDILINDAGTIEVGPYEEMTEASFDRAMALHFWAPLRLIREVVPEMKKRRDGRIVNISSIGGIVAVPHMLPYTASKFALRGLSEGLCAELAKDGITVTTVCPGLMRTGSVRHALFKGQRVREHAFFSLAAATPLTSMSARRAARKIVRAALDRRLHLILTWQAKLAAFLHGAMPRLTGHAFAWANRLLPAPAHRPDEPATPGRDIESKIAPSWLTRLNDRAAARNNES